MYKNAGRAEGPCWKRISEAIGSRRSAVMCRQRYHTVIIPRATGLTLVPWTAQEGLNILCNLPSRTDVLLLVQDDALALAYEEYKNAKRTGGCDWKKIAERVGTMRQPKSYRQRYFAVLEPKILCHVHGEVRRLNFYLKYHHV